jgi:hypothetical protein
MPTSLLYGTSHHPDAGVYEVRHLIADDQALSFTQDVRTLCGRHVGYLYDWSTPLLPDCKQCDVQARTRDAAVRIHQ